MYHSRNRKRVCAIRRAPSGSAFQKCDCCGAFVAIALTDMHKCETKRDAKRVKLDCKSGNSDDQKFENEPRSEFRFFMESFVSSCKDLNEIEADNKGYEKWKTMSMEEKWPYVLRAHRIDTAYRRTLLAEDKKSSKVDQEADSAKQKLCYKNHEVEDYFSDSYYSGAVDILDSYEREIQRNGFCGVLKFVDE